MRQLTAAVTIRSINVHEIMTGGVETIERATIYGF